MPLFELTNQHFLLNRDKTVLNINVPDIALVLFKMDKCPNCSAFEPVFKQLSADSSKVNTYGILNISKFRQVAIDAKNTKTPINHVPLLILYMGGQPKAIYRGEREYQAIRKFINDIIAKFPPQQTFMPPQQPPQQGMYGRGGYSHPPLQQNPYQPEGIGMHPNKKPPSSYAYLNDVEEEDDEKLKLPAEITPHNVPWESGYKRMETLD